ncbi:MCE family protein [Nocardioides sp. W7]|uniref:MCE family protein n=1 Tax=Nocardioides sp. W7 TaxID=2931390 RepID=UPI001FD0041E|nr:MCE family protein [Nocardioides sp. W7]
MSAITRPHAPRRAGRRAGLAGVALGLAALLTGCGLGKDLYNTPLPGGADVGEDPISVTADFRDVVDLVPQSSVKVENIAVGRVSDIELNPDGRSARVTLLMRRDVDLPVGTTARLQQTSLLGEKYIALLRPVEGAAGAGSLSSGAHIPIEETSQVAEVEQVLGALSLVVNGGGLGKFREISRELQQVSTGRPEEIRGFLRNMETFVGSLDSRKASITDALDAVAALSATLDADRDKIATALEGLSPGMQVLVEQRDQLVEMLTALDKLSDATVRTLDASQEDMVEDMKLLEPILRELAESGAALPKSLELLLTFPFPDSVLDAIKGDYLNVFVTATYTSLPDSCTGFGCPWPQLPDLGTNPPIDLLAPSASASPSASPSAAGAPSKAKPGAPTTGKPSPTGPADPTGPTGPSGSASPSPSAPGSSGAASPSPSLLPPTDSAMPGLGEPSVQVPITDTPSGAATTPGGED